MSERGTGARMLATMEHNVIAEHPAEAARLRAAIAGFFQEVGAPEETRARYGL